MFLEMVIRCLKCNLESQGVRHTRAVLKASAESRAALRVTLALLLSSLFHGLPPPPPLRFLAQGRCLGPPLYLHCSAMDLITAMLMIALVPPPFILSFKQ